MCMHAPVDLLHPLRYIIHVTLSVRKAIIKSTTDTRNLHCRHHRLWLACPPICLGDCSWTGFCLASSSQHTILTPLSLLTGRLYMCIRKLAHVCLRTTPLKIRGENFYECSKIHEIRESFPLYGKMDKLLSGY